jgi:adenosine deaminase
VLLRKGVPVTINTDDTTISNITLSEELHNCYHELGLTLAEIWGCNMHALEAAFVDETRRSTLIELFTAWAAPLAELGTR